MEYIYKTEFMNILIDNINIKGLKTIYNINKDGKYNINYILDILINISKAYSNLNYEIPNNLSQYLSKSIYTKYKVAKLKEIIKTQILCNNNDIFNNYVIIGNNTPIIIKELTVQII